MLKLKQGDISEHDRSLEITEVQWNLSITKTLGPEKQFVVQRFPLFRGYFVCTAIYLDTRKQFVIERFQLLGEFVIRSSTACMYTLDCRGFWIVPF